MGFRSRARGEREQPSGGMFSQARLVILIGELNRDDKRALLNRTLAIDLRCAAEMQFRSALPADHCR